MQVEIPQLRSFCCLSLKTASITIGIIQMIIAFLFFIFLLVATVMTSRSDPHFPIAIASNWLFGYSEVIWLLLVWILLFGIIKDKSSFVMAWLLGLLASIIGEIWNMSLAIFLYFHYGYFIEQFLHFACSVISAWVIFSYYRTMKKDSYLLM